MIRRVVRGLWSISALGLVAGGLPWALLRWVGSPIPERVPGVGETIDSIERTGVEPRTMVVLLALVVWVAWLRLMAALVVELAGVLVRRPTPTIRILGSSQRWAASLLASLVLLSGGLGGSRGALAATSSTGPVVTWATMGTTAVADEATPIAASHDPVAPPAAPSAASGLPTWTVVRNDSLWRIAERALGDGTRWRDVASANIGREVAPGVVFSDPDQVIHPGWVLVLPEADMATPPVVPAALVESAAPTVDAPDAVAGATPVDRELMPEDSPDRWSLVTEPPISVVESCPPAPAPQPASMAEEVPDPAPDTAPVEAGMTAAPSVGPTGVPAVDAPAVAADESTWSIVPLGLGAATLLATGGLGVVSARRRRSLRAAGAGARLVLPPAAELVDLERTLRAASADELVARLDLALRGTVAQLVAQDSVARVLGAIVGRDGAIAVLLDADATAVAPLTSDGPRRWVVPAALPTTDIPSGPRFAPFPCPALLPVGASADGDVYLDLEAVGILAIEGSARHRRAVLRACVAGITVSPLATGQRVVTVGLEQTVTAGAEVSVVDDLDQAIEWAATGLLPLLGVLRAGEAAASVRSRSAGEPWEPVVLVAAAEAVPPALGGELVELGTPGGRGLGVLTDAPGLGSAWKLRELDDTWRLEPLGIDVRPVGLSAEQTGRLATLLASADEPVPVAAAAEVTAPAEITPFVEPPWQLLVRTLGAPAVSTVDGCLVEFSRSKAVELVVWMARHRATASRSGARAALWDSEVANGTFANIVSDARQSLGAALDGPDGEPWIGRTLTERLELHPLVLTDVELLAARLAHARRQPPTAARATLTAGLALVAGPPFAGASYLWADAEGWVSQDTLLVTDAAAELGRLCLADGDLEGVMAATAIGLLALPGHEELVGLRMRAHAGRGDLAAVRREWEGYERVVAGDSFGDGEPSPRLVELRHELLVTRRRVG